VECKSNYGRRPLWWAAEKGHKAIVKLLLKKSISASEVEEPK
jgi:ankyrin repeat protein